MNIKILDSWLKEFLKTKATAQEIAKNLSLTSISIERVEPYKKDWLYDIEVTTNRPDLASVVGLAREAAAVLPQAGIPAEFIPPHLNVILNDSEGSQKDSSPMAQNDKKTIEIVNDPKLVSRICAVMMDVTVKPSPDSIKERLETSDIRSLNNLIDVTNYVMRTIGHPAHVFDYDRLGGQKLIIRESKKGEKITTLDKKEHVLPGGDIVAVNEKGEIVDLLGIMGLQNSVVTSQTKRILFFLDNNDTSRMRKTSMSLAIRSEAVQMNEKGIDPELAMDALLYGIKLYEEIADGKVVSDIIDIYPQKPQEKTISVSEETINKVIGVKIPLKKSAEILEDLGFKTEVSGNIIKATVPSFRLRDMNIEEDLIEEIARVYGYHNLPSVLPPVTVADIKPLGFSTFFWEKRVKEALKYWGFTETYTYSMVSETMFEGPTDEAITLKNPLTEDNMYMRKTLVPSLLQIIEENKRYKSLKIFELANVYDKKTNDLPIETRMLAGIIKSPAASFHEVKGVIEQLCKDLGITEVSFRKPRKGGIGADVMINGERVGEIEVLEEHCIDFEVNFEIMVNHATLRKTYTPLSKFPPIIEDLSLIVTEDVTTGDIIDEIKKQSPLITEVTLLDKYQNSRTFHIIYQDKEKNLTTEEVGAIRKNIIQSLEKKFKASVK